jgi:hypothetical protein
MLDAINIVRGSNEKWVELLQVWRNSILYPKQNSAPVSLKLRIKSEVRMKTITQGKEQETKLVFFFSPQWLLLRGVSPDGLD